MKQHLSVIGVLASIGTMEDALTKLERKNPEEYRQALAHITAAVEILHREGVLGDAYARVFEDRSEKRNGAMNYDPETIGWVRCDSCGHPTKIRLGSNERCRKCGGSCWAGVDGANIMRSPHEDGDFSILCGKDWCRCAQ